MDDSFEPKIVGFLCNWCSYAGADMTGTSRIPYPASIRIIRVPCSGRVDPLYVLKAFQEGADGVLVAGCHPGDCHYGDGNYHARRRYALMHSLLDFAGIEAGRLRVDWVSAAEGNRFAQVVGELTEQVRELGPWAGFRNLIGVDRTGSTRAADTDGGRTAVGQVSAPAQGGGP
jgi:coenzyme F420-reducing hydrogenase delta subunit